MLQRQRGKALKKLNTITVGELRRHLNVFPDDWELFFGDGNLQFYRTKARGDKLVQIEFNQFTDPKNPFFTATE
jgi:hypothetical protein